MLYAAMLKGKALSFAKCVSSNSGINQLDNIVTKYLEYVTDDCSTIFDDKLFHCEYNDGI